MKFAGVDLHKQSITVAVVDQARRVLARRRFLCAEPDAVRDWFAALGPCRVVVEATASYEWFARLLDPVVEEIVLAHPKKLRVIAESTRKSDRLDAQVLAEFLALDLVPRAHRPTPRQRDHRRLVRQRIAIQRRITSAKNRLRRILADHNADRPGLFTAGGQAYLTALPLGAADRFACDQITAEWRFHQAQLRAVDAAIDQFARQAPAAEQEARTLLRSIPGVGRVTAEVVLAELADVRRFPSQKHVVSYAGLAPGKRSSADTTHELHIEKNGSKHLRWILVEAAWQLVRRTARWKTIHENLKRRVGSKRAIVAVARRLLTVMTAVLDSGQPYRHGHVPGPPLGLDRRGTPLPPSPSPRPGVVKAEATAKAEGA